MKNKLIILLIIVFNILTIARLNALNGYTIGTTVKVRTGPGVDYSETGIIHNKNTTINLVSDELYNVGDTNCSIGWYKIIYNDKESYICGKYVSIGDTPGIEEPSYNEEVYEARINGVNIYVKSTASAGGTIKDVLLPGTNIKITSGLINGSGCDEGYYKINYYKNDEGYVCSKFVVKKEDITASDTDYETYLKNLGFPDDYIPYLVKLHKDHPSWEFKPLITNLYWNQVLDGFDGKTALLYLGKTSGEISPAYKNYKYYLTSLVDNIDGANWYPVKSSIVAFYLDPRNFLTEKFVFMFESLRYDYGESSKEVLDINSPTAQKYLNTISSVLNGSYLNVDEYKRYFIEAGFTHNVSPVHLTTRSKGEGAANEKYTAVSGNNPDLYGNFNINGLYNYYNISAYLGAFKPNDIYNSPVKNGLLYACGSKCGNSDTYGRPWDTREKAIKGGAQYIAERFISVGQFSMYLQRYNVNPESKNSLYTHAYQTNVLAPCSDAADSYTSYKNMGLLNEAYIFEIPIFKEMPKVVSLPNIASSINTIEGITINGKKVSNFDKDLLEFTAYVDKNDKEYNVVVNLTDSTSKVEGAGKITFEENEKLIELKVTAEDGSTRTYKMTLFKVEDTTTIEEIINNLAVKRNGNILYGISAGTLGTTLTSSINKLSPGTTITLNEANSSAASLTGILKTGQELKITTPSGETETFSLAIKGDVSGDGEITILDLLKVQKHLLKASLLTDEYLVAADTSDDNEVTILDLLRIQKYILKIITF